MLPEEKRMLPSVTRKLLFGKWKPQFEKQKLTDGLPELTVDSRELISVAPELTFGMGELTEDAR